MASEIRVLLLSSLSGAALSGDEGPWFRLLPDAKVADAKMKAKQKAPTDQGPLKTTLLYEGRVLRDSNMKLLEATGCQDQLGKITVELTVVYTRGPGPRDECCFCSMKLEDAELWDDLPRWIIKCGNHCQQKTCLRCWNLHFECESDRACPMCNASVSKSDITSSCTQCTEDRANPDMVIADGPPPPECLRPRPCEPRAYQQKAFEAVRAEHRIICLPTGTGKTLVATMAIDHFLLRGEELIPGAFACFVVNQRVLVAQQAKAIRENTRIKDLQVVEITGGKASASRECWQNWRQKNQVMVVTAEVLRKAVIDHAWMQLDADCKLLVLDEAHHAIGKSPFVKILDKVKDLKDGPRLLGLTACFLHGKFAAVEKKKNKLENRFQGSFWFPDDADIKDYLPEFTFEGVNFWEDEAATSWSQGFQQLDLLEGQLSSLPAAEGLRKVRKVVELLGWEAGKQGYMDVLNSLQDADGMIKAQLSALNESFGDGLSAKVRALIKRLEDMPQVDDFKYIIFVEEVQTAGPLAQLLERHLRNGVLPVTGRGSMKKAKQEQHLQDFRDDRCWCLVATNSLEEGVDLPTCNVVVRFDKFHNVKSHVQGTGRCRGLGRGGLILYFENDPKEFEEQAQQVAAVAKEGGVSSGSVELESRNPFLMDPSTGAELDSENCVQLLNNYVMKASGGRMKLSEAMEKGQVPLGDGKFLTTDADLLPCSEEGDKEKRFALAALAKLRELGYVDEHNMPTVVVPGPTAKQQPTRSVRPSLSQEFGEVLERKKTFLKKALEKFDRQKLMKLELKNPKGALNECLMALNPITKDFVVYQDLSAPVGVQYQIHLPQWMHSFGAGNAVELRPGATYKNTKKLAEEHAATAALCELWRLVDELAAGGEGQPSTLPLPAGLEEPSVAAGNSGPWEPVDCEAIELAAESSDGGEPLTENEVLELAAESSDAGESPAQNEVLEFDAKSSDAGEPPAQNEVMELDAESSDAGEPPAQNEAAETANAGEPPTQNEVLELDAKSFDAGEPPAQNEAAETANAGEPPKQKEVTRSLEEFCASNRLCDELLRRMREQDITDASLLKELTEEDIEELGQGLLMGERARLKKGIRELPDEP